MGYVYSYATFRGPAPRRLTKRVKALIDTGSNFSFLQPEIAQSIGLFDPKEKPRFTQDVIRGNNKPAPFPAVTATITIAGRSVTHIVLIGELPKGDEAIIGVETLEHLGLKVDPKKGEIITTRSYVSRG